jgi:hypothetical protein
MSHFDALIEDAIISALQEKAEKKLDAVGSEDDDVDNDGDTDASDAYLKKRRAAISKSVKDDA